MDDAVFKIERVNEYMIIRDVRQTAWGEVTHLEISREDNQPIHSWMDLQGIKDQLCGSERLAIEVYPPASRFVNAQHAYHLWVLPEGFRLPFGIHEADQLTAPPVLQPHTRLRIAFSNRYIVERTTNTEEILTEIREGWLTFGGPESVQLFDEEGTLLGQEDYYE